jgi:Domain of unknown function (DUF5658)
MFRSVLVAALASLMTTAVPRFAAAADAEPGYVAMSAAAMPALAADIDWSLAPARVGSSNSRGALLPSLYISLAALNAFDAYTTSKGLQSGVGRESNAMMQGIAGRSAALWAVKGGVTAMSIFAAERMWKNHNKVGAIATMMVSNGVMAVVAANNSRVLGRR